MEKCRNAAFPAALLGLKGDIAMKKCRMIIVTCAALVLIFALSACGDNNVARGENNPDNGAFYIEQIQDDPHSYLGEITLVGIVGSVSSREFTLETETGTFEVAVDYRGNQALPQIGDMLMVEGRLTENRPCCGPGFTLISTRFELVER